MRTQESDSDSKVTLFKCAISVRVGRPTTDLRRSFFS